MITILIAIAILVLGISIGRAWGGPKDAEELGWNTRHTGRYLSRNQRDLAPKEVADVVRADRPQQGVKIWLYKNNQWVKEEVEI